MQTQDSRLRDYARLIVELGINVQPGEPVVISCPVDGAPFGRLLARFAYERGASEVVFNWKDDALERLRYDYAPMEIFETVPQWAFDRLKYYYEKGANLISVSSEDPELLSGVDMKKIAAASKANNEKMKPLDKYVMSDILSWCIAAIPNPAWAKKVFPDAPTEEAAVEQLWEKIFEVTRMNAEDPLAAWQTHIDTLTKRADVLNRYHFEKLRYRASNGTDLTVELPRKHVWLAAGAVNARGTAFLPNVPTEEVFTVPSRTGVNGTLVSTRPLSYNGNLIDHFMLHFENGEVVDFSAETGADALQSLFDEDPNARRLGEVALVPHDSPISNSKLLFFNTLFDENASCHFAFGAAYPTTIEGGERLSEEELCAEGANDALLHEDFMVGCADLSIQGITADGQCIDVFIDGNFAL